MIKKVSLFSKNDKFLMLAIDHRSSLRRLLDSDNPAGLGDKQLVEFKRDIIGVLKDQFSGLLIDQEYGLPACREVSGLAKPFVLRIGKSGYEETTGGRLTELASNAAELKNLGALGVKLVLFFNPYFPTAQAQLDVGKQALEDCQKNGLPLFLEIVVYDTPNKSARFDLMLQSVEMFLAAGIRPDVFKLEYPGSAEYCQRITEMLGDIPWILLSLGRAFEVFKSELGVAVANGADGFLVGRALWQEAASLQGPEREQFLIHTLPTRFQGLVSVVL